LSPSLDENLRQQIKLNYKCSVPAVQCNENVNDNAIVAVRFTV